MESAVELAQARRGEFDVASGALLQAPRRIAKMIPAIKELAAKIESLGVSLVYSNSSKAHVLGGFAGRRAGVKTLWHFRDYYVNKVTRNFFSAMAYYNADTVICNSDFTAGQFVTHNNCRVVRNGLAQGRIKACRARGEVMTELGFPADAPLAGTAGRLERWKGIHIFIEAAAMVSEKYPDARFVVVGDAIYGDDAYLDELRAMAKEKNIEDKIAFTGFREDVFDIMGAMTIYVHPSVEPEPFGRGIVEAMFLEKPVIVPGAGGPLEIVVNEKTGLFFEPGSAKAMSKNISALLDDPVKAGDMGRAGRVRAEKEFTFERALRGITALIRKTAAV